MWSDNSTSVYAVLTLAVFLGKVIQAVCGFGGGILVLCVWVIFKVAGVYSGTLQQAVMCISLSSAMMVPVMLYITDARHTADWRLATTIVVFTSLGAPFGAAILAHLDSQRVQIFMACAIFLFIILEQFAGYMQRLITKSKLSKVPSITPLVLERIEDGLALGSKPEYIEYLGALQPGEVLYCDHHDHSNSPRDRPSTWMMGSAIAGSDSSVTAAPEGAAWFSTGPLTAHHDSVTSIQCGSKECGNEYASHASFEEIVVVCDFESLTTTSSALHQLHQIQPADVHNIGPDTSAYSCGCKPPSSSSSSSSSRSSSSSSSSSSGSSSSSRDDPSGLREPLLPVSQSPADAVGAADDHQRLTDAQQQQQQQQQGAGSSSSRPGWLKVAGYGSVAGTVGGVMGSLTGAGGPPLMIMYRLLNTPKDTVRGTNAVTGLFQVKLIPYFYMGLIQVADIQLYVVVCAASVVGVFVGNSLAGKLNQQAFQTVLLWLMIICCGLMFVSGFGLLKDCHEC